MQKVGKEVKIGLAVIGVLLVAFGYVLVKKLTQPSDSAGDAAAAAAAPAPAPKEGADRPTMLTASDADGAADPKRSRWAGGPDRSLQGMDSKPGDSPGGTQNNPFAATVREAAATPEPRGASQFAADDSAGAGASDATDSHRREGRPDDRRFGRAVQASDPAPLPAAGNSPSEARSIFAKSEAAKSAAENDTRTETAAAGQPAADPFQRRSADAAPTANDPFQRRTVDTVRPTDASPAVDSFPRKSPDSGLDAREPAPKSFADHPSSRPNMLAPVEDAGLKPTPPGDAAADSRNPLRHSDAQPAADAGDSGNRWSNQGHLAPADSAQPAVGSSRISPASSGPQPLVADENRAKPGQYIVQPSDNYWTISEKVYGTGGYFKAIFEHNRRQHPTAERLQVGEALLVPDVAVLQRDYPDLCPKASRASAPQRMMPASARIRPGTRAYVVEEGDTLFEIARRQLGKPSRWGEIYQLNREVLGTDFDYLKPGTELLLPTESRPDPIARQPNGTAEK